jgi:DNA repair protein RadC
MAFKVPRQTVRIVRDAASVECPRKVDRAETAVEMFREILRDLPHEEVHVLAVDATNRPVGLFMIARGGAGGAGVLPADIFRPLIACGARGFIMAHNHPSGDPSPSSEDYAMTRQVKAAGDILGVPLLDHLVVTESGWRSCL